MATRWKIPALKEALEKSSMTYEIMIEDVYQTMLQTRIQNEEALQKAEQDGKKMDWTAYHSYNEVSSMET